ncbi:G-type lectin S-receptor-like serine/threonine-protein kinase At2g19130 [Hordeum vulgare subsp. vulgare]|uniref:Receptor-like serine/threonine-protein kinase n=1 Tax=Hordeum vulgare subsp. vulgare TaxID=112509 RepID=A0A8I6WWK4_HORVV|nr:G-type lectin S-receptor-like serine/threonine-protein kinase At2g19130 [Hordeum vulgare subsp. vulgare]
MGAHKSACTISSPVQAMVALYILLGLLLSHAPPSSSATDALTAGQVLMVGDKLVSSNGKFAFGFFQFQPAASTIISKSTTPVSNWYLGIWFNKIPVFTTVWVANREDPIPNNPSWLNQTHFQISSDGNLVIIHQAAVIWSTHIVSNNRTQNTTTGVLLENTGNLALTSSSAQVLWQSFDYPTDVLLPTGKVGWNKVTGLNRRGISRKSTVDPGLGSYSIELETNGNGIILKRLQPSVVYRVYEPETSTILKLLPRIKKILQLDPRTQGVVVPDYVNTPQEQYYTYTSPDESSSSFLSLDISGQIKLNIWSRANQSWQTVLADPVDACTPAATCGPFTVCDGTTQAPCVCMKNFTKKSPQHWEFGDRTQGCTRNTPLYCTSDNKTTSSTDMFHPIAHVTLPYHSQSIDLATTHSKCEEACLSSCSCTAYSYDNRNCSVWHGKLLGVSLDDGIEIHSEDILYLRLAAKDLPTLPKDKRKPNVGVITAASISSFGFLMLMMLLAIWRKKLRWSSLSVYDNQGPSGIITFTYTDLARATKNFSEKIGTGGFGSVYKGVLSDSTIIAVKRLDGTRQGEKQFRAEVSTIGLIQHVNLVKLIGFCCQGDNRLLVYEHMLNGSLDSHLFQSDGVVLNWETRYQIVLGMARGLSYLHRSCRECIIHCDIKPENILLDASFFPKIADFGMATFIGRNFSRVLTTFRGTIGYLAPEWLSGIAITPKVDVYSFGMVLFEIISGRRNSAEENSGISDLVEYFPIQVIRKLHGEDMQSLVDPRLEGMFDLEKAERVCKVALWCIQDNESHRPTMSEVVHVLEGLNEIDLLPMPRLLAAITERRNGTETSV